MIYTLDIYGTFVAATAVMLIGRFLILNIKVLSDFNIPEPVAGGIAAALIVWAVRSWFNVTLHFDMDLQNVFMLAFFSFVGLGADLMRLKAGGRSLFLFVGLVALYVIVQDVIGVGLSSAFGLKPLTGLVVGTVSLIGGHGTAGAWGPILESDYGVENATTIGIAVATFGLVAGGVIAGPVAKFLLRRNNYEKLPKPINQTQVEKVAAAQSLYSTQHSEAGKDPGVSIFDRPDEIRLITASATIQVLALFSTCIIFSGIMTNLTKGTVIGLPSFVWALIGGVILRNVLTHFFKFDMFDRAIDVYGSVSLSMFLSIALLSLELWKLADLPLPILLILLVQIVVLMGYVIFITFRVMGKNYDAVVLAAGQCGFGLGATPTAIANMQAITDRYGPSPKAFLIVPMVAAFFMDLINAIVIQIFTQLPFLQ